ncbi:MAG: malto-oligosyltrehalose synthase, partial [Deltaproteobacteria bacterium]|nr:malto-oligosyltrehalose synthase [Deltaproteobacteria bacterium]
RQEADDPIALVKDLLTHWQDGRVKLYLIYKALHFRRTQSPLFQEGDYIPLYASGKFREHVCAFARKKGEAWALAVVPRLTSAWIKTASLPVGRECWGDSRLYLPRQAPTLWLNLLTREELEAASGKEAKELRLSDVFQTFPVALLTPRKT